LPANRVEGRIAREVSGVRKTLATAFAEGAKAGRQHACTFDTLMHPEPETSIPTSGAWSGHSSNDGIGLV
jgi:hypothetical protein